MGARVKAQIKGTWSNLIDLIQYLYRMYILDRLLGIVSPSQLFITPVEKMTKNQLKVMVEIVNATPPFPRRLFKRNLWSTMIMRERKRQGEQK